MQAFSPEKKWAVYVALNLAFCATLLVGTIIFGGSLAELPYVTLMFAICSSPIPFIRRLNDVFAMLGVAMAAYFVKFALLDAFSIMSLPKPRTESDSVLDAAELVLLTGAFMQVIGFHVGATIAGARSRGVPKDWPRSLLLPTGLLLWSLSCSAAMYQIFVVHVDASDAAVTAGLMKLGVWKVSLLILVGNYAGPLGIVILSYWWAVWRPRWSSVLMLGIIFIQFAVGWVIDIKEVAISAPIIMLLTRFVVLGKVPVRWLVCSLIGIVLVFPILTAKRAIMTEALQVTNAQALPRTEEILRRAFLERNAALEGKYTDKTQTFLERSTDKGSVELFVRHVGKDQPYKMGATFSPMLYMFIPRVILSDKPGANSAQTFNRDFHLSEDPDTYISPSHIGELYWNFGLTGTIVGMALIGVLLGFVFARFDLSVQTSLTRALVIIVTFYELVALSEGQIELQYVVWARTLLLIGILHWLFDRTVQQREVGQTNSVIIDDGDPQLTASRRFPNLMR